MSLAQKSFKVGILTKMSLGLIELFLGIAVLAIKPEEVADILAEIQRWGGAGVTINLTGAMAAALIAGKLVTAGYLMAHGIPKILIGLALLRQKLWAYPLALIILAGFILFQVYLVGFHHSFWILVLAAGDSLIAWLALNEYRQQRRLVKPATKDLEKR